MKVSVPYVYEARLLPFDPDGPHTRLFRGSVEADVAESRLDDMPVVLRYQWQRRWNSEAETLEMRMHDGRLYAPHHREAELREYASRYDMMPEIPVKEILWTRQEDEQRRAEEAAGRLLAVDGQVWMECHPPRIVVKGAAFYDPTGTSKPLEIHAHDRPFRHQPHQRFALDEVEMIAACCAHVHGYEVDGIRSQFEVVRPDLFEDDEPSNAAALELAGDLLSIYKDKIDEVEAPDFKAMVALRNARSDSPDLGGLAEILEEAMTFVRPRMDADFAANADEVISRSRLAAEKRGYRSAAPGVG